MPGLTLRASARRKRAAPPTASSPGQGHGLLPQARDEAAVTSGPGAHRVFGPAVGPGVPLRGTVSGGSDAPAHWRHVGSRHPGLHHRGRTAPPSHVSVSADQLRLSPSWPAAAAPGQRLGIRSAAPPSRPERRAARPARPVRSRTAGSSRQRSRWVSSPIDGDQLGDAGASPARDGRRHLPGRAAPEVPADGAFTPSGRFRAGRLIVTAGWCRRPRRGVPAGDCGP
jgi:hypothetical protein